MLNQDSPFPLYYQLYKILSERIEAGEYGEGARIPSENELARKYKIGRPTVRQATDRLIREGLLERRKGSGAFVRARQQEVGLFSIAGTSAAFHKSGFELEQRIVDRLALVDPPGDAVSDSDNPFAGKRAYFFSRISLVEDLPVLFEFIFLDPGVFAGIERYNIEGTSLARIVEDYFFMKPTGGTQKFSIAFLDAVRAVAFGVDIRTPLLLVRRSLDFRNKAKAIYSDIYCRTERFEFSQDLGGLFHG